MSSIFSYTDHREYLRDELDRKRNRNPAFSMRAAAAHLGIGSGTLSRILSGARDIGPNLLPAIIEFLGLKSKEAEYFSLLVRFSRTANPGKKRQYYEEMMRMRAVSRQKIPEETYRIFEQWHCLALHQLLRMVPDCAEPAKLGSMLDPQVSGPKMKKALDLLLHHGLIRANHRGGFSPVDVSFTTGETWRGVAIHGFQQTTATMAAQALDRFSKEQRDISTLTIALSESGFCAAREILNRARQELLALDEKENAPKRVYHVNFHLFPMSRTDVARGESCAE